jgi:hypothetical protein
MNTLLRLTVLAAVLASLPLTAYAQTNPVFDQPFTYTDRDGTGTLTLTPVTPAPAGAVSLRIQAVLEQGGRRFSGAGIYAEQEQVGLVPPPALLAFTLLDSAGRSYFFEGTVGRGGSSGFTGQGTYFPVTSPQTSIAWRIQSADGGGGGGGEPIVSARPNLRGGWQENTFSEAVGGTYYATFNTNQGVGSTATWSGTLPASGRYRIEAFLPAQRQGFVPRTERATYRISVGDPQGDAVQRVSQVVTTSQWVDLGTYNLGTNYQVVLTDETGEPAFTRSVVANAVRLTPVTGSGSGLGSGF